jgi:hypothetical protein
MPSKMSTSYREHERGSIVEGPNYKRQRSIHSRLKRQNDAVDSAWRAARKTWNFLPPSPIIVTLHKTTGGIPAGLVLSVPHETGCWILLKRLGRILEQDDVAIDVIIEGELEDAVEALGL